MSGPQTCCHYFTLRRGCVAIGAALLALYGLAGVALTTAAVVAHQRSWRETTPLAVTAPLTLLPCVLHVLLVVGARAGRPPLLLAWLIGCGVLFTAQTAALLVGVYLLAAGTLWKALLAAGVSAVLQALCWYWFSAVRAHYLDLSTEVRRERRLRSEDGWTTARLEKKGPAARQ